MVKMGRAIDEDSPHEALHDLRKKGKELRYLLEFFASLYPADVVKPMVATLKGLQDVLGRFQDREVQSDALRALGDEIATIEGGAAALMAMGVLVAAPARRAGAGARAVRGALRAVRRQAATEARRADLWMTAVIALYNIKGGVGKTSAAVNLAWIAAEQGARVLLWDLDPQGAASYMLRIKPKVRGGGDEARARQERSRGRC